MEKSKHPNYCPGYKGTLRELAEEINNMSHDARAELARHQHALAEEQRKNEEDLKREVYFPYLKNIEKGYRLITSGEIECWKVCEKHTEVVTRED